MPAQRVPGPLGLETDPSPGPDGPWERWPVRPVVPAGPAADALHGATPLGLESPQLMEPEAPEGDEDIKPAERFRYMEIQGDIVKVRCTPLWQGRVLGLLGGCDEDEKAQDTLVRTVKHHKPKTRGAIVTFLMTHLSSEGKQNSAIAGKLAKIKLPEVEGEKTAGLSEELKGGASSRVARALPAVQRGRSQSNG